MVSASVLLSGCATKMTNGDICPPLKEYDNYERNKLADEIDKLPQDSIIPMFLGDYLLLRDLTRVCHSTMNN